MPSVDKEKCIGCGLCAGICPDGFEIVGGKAHIKNAAAECIGEAADSCPQSAISVE